MTDSEKIALIFELAFGYQPNADEAAAVASEIRDISPDCYAPLVKLLQLRRTAHSPDLDPLYELQNSTLSQELQRVDSLDRGAFETLYQGLFQEGREFIIGQAEYLPQHKERFWELFNACACVVEGRPQPRILEFGTSEFSALFKRLFPDAVLHLSDRPTPPGYIGFNEAVAARIADCDAYFSLDLELPSDIGALPGLDHHSYDFIALAEVLEHLVVNPVELLTKLLKLLKPTGALYLTTPNIFRAELRKKWIALENPNAIYPESGENWDRHHHHREFGAVELLRFIQQAGGEIRAFYYSSCWDSGDILPTDQRANLVYLVQPAASGHDPS